MMNWKTRGPSRRKRMVLVGRNSDGSYTEIDSYHLAIIAYIARWWLGRGSTAYGRAHLTVTHRDRHPFAMLPDAVARVER